MVLKKLAGIFGANKQDENTMVLTRALEVHGLNEYRETTQELERLKQMVTEAASRTQRQDIEKLLDRVQCRQDALKSAAVLLLQRLGGKTDIDVHDVFSITDVDQARVSGMSSTRQSPANEVARFLIEEAQSDFIAGRA